MIAERNPQTLWRKRVENDVNQSEYRGQNSTELQVNGLPAMGTQNDMNKNQESYNHLKLSHRKRVLWACKWNHLNTAAKIPLLLVVFCLLCEQMKKEPQQSTILTFNVVAVWGKTQESIANRKPPSESSFWPTSWKKNTRGSEQPRTLAHPLPSRMQH